MNQQNTARPECANADAEGARTKGLKRGSVGTLGAVVIGISCCAAGPRAAVIV